jgi:ferritin-like metal-binding protein YciE
MTTLNEAFEDLIKDIHNAEKQITKALPKMIKKCENEQLRQGLEQHLAETNDQIQKVEQVCKELGIKPTGEVCQAMQGLIEEGDDHLQRGKTGPVMDAVIIAACQKIEHYEICAYGTARAWAEQIGCDKSVIQALDGILKQEEMTDQKLNTMALDKVNKAAAEMDSAGSGTPRGRASMR